MSHKVESFSSLYIVGDVKDWTIKYFSLSINRKIGFICSNSPVDAA